MRDGGRVIAGFPTTAPQRVSRGWLRLRLEIHAPLHQSGHASSKGLPSPDVSYCVVVSHFPKQLPTPGPKLENALPVPVALVRLLFYRPSSRESATNR